VPAAPGPSADFCVAVQTLGQYLVNLLRHAQAVVQAPDDAARADAIAARARFLAGTTDDDIHSLERAVRGACGRAEAGGVQPVLETCRRSVVALRLWTPERGFPAIGSALTAYGKLIALTEYQGDNLDAYREGGVPGGKLLTARRCKSLGVTGSRLSTAAIAAEEEGKKVRVKDPGNNRGHVYRWDFVCGLASHLKAG
jgi:hypothetical protein